MRYCLPRLSALASLSFVILLLAACRTTPPAPSGSQLPASQVQQLKNMRLAQQLPVPVQGIKRHGLTDTWGASRSSGRTHEGIDILAPRGTKVFLPQKGSLQTYAITIWVVKWFGLWGQQALGITTLILMTINVA